MVLLFGPLNQISFVHSETHVTIFSLLCRMMHCRRLCFSVISGIQQKGKRYTCNNHNHAAWLFSINF